MDIVREVTFKDGKSMAAKLGCPFFETSALTGEKVDEAFDKISESI